MSDAPRKKSGPRNGPGKGPPGNRSLRSKIDQAVNDAGKPAPRPKRDKRPPLRVMTTTHWSYPSQHYNDSMGKREQGSKDYVGATPSWVIWQLLQRYTRAGDVVIDPMCGSGTTLDVCADLDRKGLGFDLNPQRDAITRADARELPVDDESADFFFMDPPYSTHIDYSDDPNCIGKLDAGATSKDGMTGEAYYVAMEEVIAEMQRVLRPGRYGAIYVSDSWRKQKGKPGGVFMPIAFELFSILRDYMDPIDIIVVERFNAKLNRGNWHKAAEEGNFYLRGFNYLMIARKA